MKNFVIAFLCCLAAFNLTAQTIDNEGAKIVCTQGSYWVIGSGDFTLINRDAANPATMSNLTIQPGASLTVDPQSFLTVNQTIQNDNGIPGFVLQADDSHSASLLHNNDNVAATGRHYLGASTWNLISSPFLLGPGATAGALIPTAGGDAYLRPYNDGIGWGSYIIPVDYQIIPKKGYAVWLETANIFTFTGYLMNGIMNKSLVYTASNHWNLTGNPYPSSLDWDLIERHNTSASIYFWDNAYAGANNGNYLTYNALSGVGVPSSTTNIIPPFQGFFVEATASGAYITFNNDARKHSEQPFYKALNSQTQSIVRLKITDPTDKFDELLVCMNPGAGNDFDEYDSRKMPAGSDAPEISTMAGSEPVVINAILTTPMEIPVNISTSQAGNFRLKAFDITNDQSIAVIFEDRQAGTFTDLRLYPENTLNLLQGANTGRFFLHFGTPNGITEPDQIGLNTIVQEGNVYVYSTGSKTIDKVSLYDMAGRLVSVKEYNSENCLVNSVKLSRGIYIIQALAGKQTLTKKVNIIY